MIVTESKYKYPWIGIPSNVISTVLFIVFLKRLDIFIFTGKGITNLHDFSLMSTLLIGGVVLKFISKVEIQTRVKSNSIETGTKWMFKKELSNVEMVNTESLKSFEIIQKPDKFFEIIAERKDGFKVIVFRIANRRPAKKKFEELLETELKNWC